MKDLEPKDGSLEEKLRLNSFNSHVGSVLSLRLARINHACISNACHYFEDTTNVKVVHSTREIKGICKKITFQKGKRI